MTTQPPNPRSVFGRAVELESAADRKVYLDEACAGAPDVRERVEVLLRAHEAAGGFLQPASAPADTASYASSPEPPSTVGPYKLLEKIGEGGMGEVWVADQVEPIKRRVALKLIKPGMDSRGVLARFEAERQALAVMDHPNIAKVLDAGTTPDGRPYFVMELVKGTPITEFCDVRKLTPKERLELFVPVCQAIQHAHMKGIIHRDIKPSNVLVELYDDKAVAKVIDFGVAKAIGQRLTEKTIYTGFGALVGTPTYIAPEQATFNALDVDTRADVYALGVLLYELLAGSPPIEKDRLNKAALDEVLRIVRDEEPVRPSQRLSTSQSKATIAATRQSEPAALSQMMKGELDWIVMKALEKDRTRRYDTATALAKDVERYLSGDSVEACPPTLGYRLKKAYRRNRAAVLVGTAFAILMTAGVAGASLLAVRANNAERVARQAREAAEVAGLAAADERDRTRVALDDLTRVTTERRAEQYAMTMTTLPVAWESGAVSEAHRLLASLRPGPGESDLRNFEWRYWDRQLHSELSGGQLSVQPLSADRGNTTDRVWAMSEDGGRVAVLHHAMSARDRSDKVILVKVWDAATRKQILAHEIPDQNHGDRLATCSLSLSRDGKRLGIDANAWVDPPGGKERGAGVRCRRLALDVDSGKVLVDLTSDDRLGYATTIRISPDGRYGLAQQPDPEKATKAVAAIHDLDAGGKEVAKLAGVRWGGFGREGQILGWDSPGVSTPKVWDAATGREVRTLGTANVGGWTPSPDGTRLFGVSGLNVNEPGKYLVAVLDVATGKKLADVPLPAEPNPDKQAGASLFQPFVRAVSPDNSSIVIQRTKPGRDRIEWVVLDAQQGRVLFTLVDTQAAISRTSRSVGIRFSPNGKRLIVHNYADNTLAIHDATTGRLVNVIRGHVKPIQAFSVTPDGTRLRCVELDGTLKEWAVEAEQPVRIECGGRVQLGFESRGFELSADGRWMTAAFDRDSARVVRVWSADGKVSKELTPRRLQAPGRVLGEYPVVSRDGKRVAFGRNTHHESDKTSFANVTVWDVASGKELLYLTGRYSRVPLAISPDGDRIAVVRRDGDKDSCIAIFHVASGKELQTLALPPGKSLSLEMQFRPDGKRLIGFVAADRGDRAIAQWDLEREELVSDFQLGPYPGFTPNLAWSPDGRSLFIASFRGDRPMTIHDADTGRLLTTLFVAERGGRLGLAARPAFSPDGLRVACAVDTPKGRFIKVWDALSGRELLALPSASSQDRGLSNYPHFVAFTPEGHHLLEYVAKHKDVVGISRKDYVEVTTWDATPCEGAKK